MDFFKRFFDNSRRNAEPEDDDFFRRASAEDDHYPRRGFDIFTDPLHMQQYFEQEMNDMLKLFGFGEFSFFVPSVPTLEDRGSQNSQGIRDQFLKKGYEKPAQRNDEKIDKDLDDKITSGDLDSVLNGKYDQQVTPYERQQPGHFFYGKSQSFKTITNHDGSVETHRTVRDNEGNEEISVCRRIGVKEYCVTRKKDKSGKEEVTEQFVNMDDSEKDIFTKNKENTPIFDGNNGSDFPFNNFFK